MGVGGENTSYTLRPIRAEKTEPTSNALNVLHPLNGDEQKSRLPYPVGKPFATPDPQAEKRNRYKLQDDGGIDPQSLF